MAFILRQQHVIFIVCFNPPSGSERTKMSFTKKIYSNCLEIEFPWKGKRVAPFVLVKLKFKFARDEKILNKFLYSRRRNKLLNFNSCFAGASLASLATLTSELNFHSYVNISAFWRMISSACSWLCSLCQQSWDVLLTFWFVARWVNMQHWIHDATCEISLIEKNRWLAVLAALKAHEAYISDWQIESYLEQAAVRIIDGDAKSIGIATAAWI